MKIVETHKGKAGRIEGRFDAAFYEAVREMPGKKKFEGATLLFEMTRANIEFITKQWPDAKWESGRAEHILSLLEQEAARVQQEKKPLPPEATSFHFKTVPMQHQAEAFALYKDLPYFGLFFEQGLGKTKSILDIAAYKWSTGEIDTLLVSAPNGVHIQWITEAAEEHLPEFLGYEGYAYTSTATKKALAEMEVAFGYDTTNGLRILTINKEACITAKGEAFLRRALSSGKVMWVVDESPFIKTPGASVTKTHLKLGPQAAVRSILTGTPVGKGVEDLYAQLKFLHEDVLGYRSYYTFKNRYCEEVQIYGAPAGAKQIVAYKNVDELKERMGAYCMRRTADECLDLKEQVYIKRYVELTPEQKRVYVQLIEETVAQIDSGEIVTADQAIVRLIRLQQITNGYIKDVEGNIVPLSSNRPKAAKEYVEDAGGKVVIWARFHYDIDMLQDYLKKYGVAIWDGRRSTEEKVEAKNRFIKDPKTNIFLANQDSAGTGTDGLQHASRCMLFYSNNFKASVRWQAESRLHRYGQQHSVAIGDLIARGTVDARIQSILTKRKETADMVLDRGSLRSLIL